MADGLRRAHLPKVRLDDLDDGNGSPTGNAAWIAALGPQIAEPLAAWLDQCAGYCDAGQYAPTALTHDRPMAMARVLLGVPAPEETA